MSISGTVSEIINIKLWDREIWVGNHSMSLKMAPFDRSYTTFSWLFQLCCVTYIWPTGRKDATKLID